MCRHGIVWYGLLLCVIAWCCVVWFWGQKYECADLLTIPVTLTTRNAATASVQIQQQIDSVHMDAVGAAAPSAAADPGPTHSHKPQGGHF